MLLFNIFFLIVNIFNFTGLSFPLPYKDQVTICNNLNCASKLVKNYQSKNVIFIGFIVTDVAQDPYMPLYLGNIIDLFDGVINNKTKAHALIIQNSDIAQAAALLLNILPKNNSIFVSIEHGLSSFGINSLVNAKKYLGLVPSVVFHVNHEKPWNFGQLTEENEVLANTAFDITFHSQEELIKEYQSYPLILRNYYYSPLHSPSGGRSLYVPVFVPHFGNIIGNSSSSIFARKSIKSSERNSYCYFKGRIDYSSSNITVEDKRNNLFPEIERKELLKLLQHSKSGKKCIVTPLNIDTVNPKSFAMIYTDYMEQLVETIFALCPGGNNRETFRHYEALELGAIPIMIQPQNLPSESDFLNHELWKDYPGPILKSWIELETYLNSMTPSKVDELQSKVVKWYENFKIKTKEMIGNAIKSLFERYDVDTGYFHSIPQQCEQKSTALRKENENDASMSEITSMLRTLMIKVIEQDRELEALRNEVSLLKLKIDN
eukprot:gene5020-7008_t